jgi:hypothetical protein
MITARTRVIAYLRALQERDILKVRVAPIRTRIRMKTLRENLPLFVDYDAAMPEDEATLESGLKELINEGLLRGSDGKPQWVCITSEGASALIVSE